MKDPKMHLYIIQLIGQQSRNELTSLCSEAVNSILRYQSANALIEFTWGKLHELAARAPTSLSLLQMCTYTRKPHHNRKGVIGMCAVLTGKTPLCVHYDFTGTKIILPALNVCMSHQITTTLVNTLGANHDMKVLSEKTN